MTRTTTYFVSIASAAGCESQKIAAVANVIQFDDPVIIERNDSLSTNYISGIQWFENGVALSNGQTQIIHPATSGKYSVTVQVSTCVATAEYSYVSNVITEIKDPEESVFEVYPNPFKDEIFLKSSLTPGEITQVRLYDLLGHLVGNVGFNAVSGGAISFDIKSSIPSGVYLLSVGTLKGVREVRVVKQ